MNDSQSNISKRIEELRKENDLSRAFLAEKMGITEEEYLQMENSDMSIEPEILADLSDLFQVSTDFLIKGKNKVVKICRENGFIPLIKISAQAGFIKNYESDYSFEDYDWFRIPGFNPTSGQLLFEVEGSSMEPTLFHKDIIICQPRQDLNKTAEGNLILVVTRGDLYIKRLGISENPDYIVLNSDNPLEEPHQKIIRKADVLEIMAVRGKTGTPLIPTFQISSRKKIEVLEEELQFLKKESASLQDKIGRA